MSTKRIPIGMAIQQFRRYERKLKQAQRDLIKEQQYQVQRLIKSVETEQKTVIDFEDINDYISDIFPNIDITDIPIYITSPRIMRRIGIDNAAGCYLEQLKVIIVRNTCQSKCDNSDFIKALNKLIQTKIDVDDVVVHECVHAISAKARSGGGVKFIFSEEEFAYTNCVDYYKKKGQTEEDIVQSIFMPFCIQDVTADIKFMSNCWKNLNVVLPQQSSSYSEYSKRMNKLFDKHAAYLVPIIVEEAKNRAYRMIELYNKYGRYNIPVKPTLIDFSLRMSIIDEDCDL